MEQKIRKNNRSLLDLSASPQVKSVTMNSGSLRDRFQKSRPNSMCDKADMVPAAGNAAAAAAAGADAANGAEGDSSGGGGGKG